MSRVRPPNTTMPKTLAALASSQYATAFELVSGYLDERAIASSAVLIASLSLAVDPKFRRENIHGCCICLRASLKWFRRTRLLVDERIEERVATQEARA